MSILSPAFITIYRTSYAYYKITHKATTSKSFGPKQVELFIISVFYLLNKYKLKLHVYKNWFFNII